MLCPVCENESTNTQQCTNCEWQFVYFTQEPTEQEQKEYTNLLQNYRVKYYYDLALWCYDEKSYEDTIKACFISCEHNLSENPLVLLALTYKELENHEESLKYANMALQINSNNEIANQILVELNTQSVHSEEVLKLTPEILKKDMFETSEEYANRIKNLGYVELGIIKLQHYDADGKKLTFRASINRNLINVIFHNRPYLIKYETILKPVYAKELYSLKSVPLIASLEMIDSIISLTDMKINRHSFLKEHTKYQKSLNEKYLAEEKAKKQKIAFEEAEKQNFAVKIKNLPIIWFDKITGLEWNTEQISSYNKVEGWNLAGIYLVNQLKAHLNDLSTENSKLFLQKIEREYIPTKTYLLYRKKPDNLITSISKGIGSFIKKRI